MHPQLTDRNSFDNEDLNRRRPAPPRPTYECNLENWILPRWGNHTLDQVKSVAVEDWLDGIKRAKGTRAKIRNLMSALFTHATLERLRELEVEQEEWRKEQARLTQSNQALKHQQQGSVQREKRLSGSDVWIYRWYETGIDGTSKYRKAIVGTVATLANET
jgi:hypothetical protein